MKNHFYQDTLFLIIFVCLSNISFSRAKHAATGVLTPVVPKTGIDFIENKGQWNCDARFKANIPGGALFLTAQGFVYNFTEHDDLHKCQEGIYSTKLYKGHAYKVNFVGGSPATIIAPSQKRSYYHNYFLDNDTSRWAGKVGLYGQVNYINVYPGINVVLYSRSEKSVEYDFAVASGSDPALIGLSFDGVTPGLDEEGNLHIRTAVNEIIEKSPYAYQIIDNQKVEVKCRYKLNKSVLSFDFPEGYNKACDLIIDPVLVFASFSGATGNTYYYAHSTTFDLSGNTYTAALCTDSGWPTTTGAYQERYSGWGIGISKINAFGTALVYATYFGGKNGGVAYPNTLRVNANNELFMAGNCNSTTIPVTANAFQKAKKGLSDIYVAHFSQDGSALLGSTLIGGSDLEANLPGDINPYNAYFASGINPVEIAFAKDSSVWVTSNTRSTDFPVSTNAAQSTNAGLHDAVIFNLSADCSSLLYSTYFGGSEWDGGVAIEVDTFNNNIVVAGWTESMSLPNTAGRFKSTNAGQVDGFVTTYNGASFNNTATTFLGTGGKDFAQRIAFDSEYNIYIAGMTDDGSYPVSPDVYFMDKGSIFIHKLNKTLNASLVSTTLGVPFKPLARATAMIVDNCGDILLSTMDCGGGPITPNAFQTEARPFWLCALTKNFETLYFGSYFGSSADHYHPGVARMDSRGIIYQSVCSALGSSYFPTTPNSFAPEKLNDASCVDNLTFKFNFEATGVQADFILDPTLGLKDTGCAPFYVSMKNLSSSAIDYVWDFGDGSAVSTEVSPSHTFVLPGTYTITLCAKNDTSCITIDTAYMDITVLYAEPPEIVVSDTTLCSWEQHINIGVEIKNPSAQNKILWQPASGILSSANQRIIMIDPAVNQIYYVTVKDTIPGICGFSTTDTVHIDFSPRALDIITHDTVVCQGAVLPIVAKGTSGYLYRWTPSTGINDTTLLEPEITVNESNVYTLTASYPSCPDTTVQISIGMEEYPLLDIGSDQTVCQGDQIALTAQIVPFNRHYQYQWQPADRVKNATEPNTYLIADTSGVYSLTVRSPAGCARSDSLLLTVIPNGFGNAIADTGYCLPASINLWASGGSRYRWEPGYGLSDSLVASPVASPLTPTQYTVYIWDENGCLDSREVRVDVWPAAVLNMLDSVIIYPGERYHLQPETNALYFEWFPPSGISDTRVSDPWLSPEVRTRYFVEATTEHGCVLRDSVDILINCVIMDIPNAFVPQSTGVNSLFRPAWRGVVALKRFNIYDRWGVKMYESTDIHTGWDGSYKGKPQPMGAYVYELEALTECGTVYYRKGSVLLLR